MNFLRLLPILAALLAACSHSPPRQPTNTAAPPAPTKAPARSALGAAAANSVLFRALALVGTPYRYGGNTPEGGFDCSGLVGYVFNDAAGMKLPRNSADIGALNAPTLKLNQLQSGDLVFFAANRRISHVGIYVGEGRFVHAPNSGGTVRLDRLDMRGWRETFSHGKRIIP
jgi:cell wall-associated NlpC family hydrolase